MDTEPKLSKIVTLACTVLHNFLRVAVPTDRYIKYDDKDTAGKSSEKEKRQFTSIKNFNKLGANKPTTLSKKVRGDFVEFFNTAGYEEWADEYIYDVDLNGSDGDDDDHV